MSLDRIVEDIVYWDITRRPSNFRYTSNFFKSCCYSRLSWTIVNLTCSPMDTIFKTSRWSATSIYVLLWINPCDYSMCVNKYQQSLSEGPGRGLAQAPHQLGSLVVAMSPSPKWRLGLLRCIIMTLGLLEEVICGLPSHLCFTEGSVWACRCSP